MNLAKTSYLSAIATVVKMLAALIINKAVAIFIGPAGLALIGQYQNFSQLAMIFAQGGISKGVTKYTAEYGKDDERLPLLFSTSLKISLYCSATIAIFLIFLSPWLSSMLFNSNDYTYIFIVLGFTIFLFVLNNLLLSILNGLKEVKTFISINIIQSIYSLIFTSILVIAFGLHGALIALATNQSIVFLVVIYMLRQHAVIKLKYFTGEFNKPEGRKLLNYVFMALTSALTVPISQLLIRNYIGENIGWQEAGYWQAIWYISSMYLMVVTTSLSIYYLPRLSEITGRLELGREVLSGCKIILPVVITLSLLIFIMKGFIVQLLFTSEFTAMLSLFKWQLIGNVFKTLGWLLAFIMLAKTMTRTYIFTEIIFSLCFVVLSVLLVSNYGVVGVTYAYALNYVIYLFSMIFVMRKYFIS